MGRRLVTASGSVHPSCGDLPTVYGAPMLVAQAAIAFERWTGLGGTEPVMRAAIEPLLADANLSP